MNEKLTALGFGMTFSGPRPDCKDGWPNIRFDVTIAYKGKLVLKTDYGMGVGHVKLTERGLRGLSASEESMFYAWKKNPSAKFSDPHNQAALACKLAVAQGVKPGLSEVIHCLLSDGEAFFNAQSFEDWAADFGYDSDSRKAESIYRACMEIGRQFSASVPLSVLESAREIVRDC